jgi:hypothetical protein
MPWRRIEAGIAPISCYATRYSAVAEAATELSSSVRLYMTYINSDFVMNLVGGPGAGVADVVRLSWSQLNTSGQELARFMQPGNMAGGGVVRHNRKRLASSVEWLGLGLAAKRRRFGPPPKGGLLTLRREAN